MRSLLAAVCLIAGCTFPSDGVMLQGDPPDAEVEGPDACVGTTEICDGIDNDCDGNPDEGFASNDPCDGPDSDECIDDVMVCDSSGGEVCSDGDDDIELCNAIDDDCDGNMDEAFTLDVACDGVDGDMCNEGVTACTSDGSGTECNDTTDTIVETCNTLDDDCDGTPDQTFDFTSDEANCNTCGNTCTNGNGTTMCLARVCTPVCNNGAAQCDADPDNGCELQDTNPTCTATPADVLTVDGDVGADTDATTGANERVVRVHLVESSMGPGGSGNAITAAITLTSGAGATYHLTVLCPSCAGAAVPATSTDVVNVGRADGSGDRSFDVFAIITYDGTVPSTTCASWTLSVAGNSGTANRCGGT